MIVNKGKIIIVSVGGTILILSLIVIFSFIKYSKIKEENRHDEEIRKYAVEDSLNKVRLEEQRQKERDRAEKELQRQRAIEVQQRIEQERVKEDNFNKNKEFAQKLYLEIAAIALAEELKPITIRGIPKWVGFLKNELILTKQMYNSAKNGDITLENCKNTLINYISDRIDALIYMYNNSENGNLPFEIYDDVISVEEKHHKRRQKLCSLGVEIHKKYDLY